MASARPSGDIDASATYAQATAAEYSGNFNSAYSLYLSAAQKFLHLAGTLREESRAAERAKCKTDAATCLTRAERIKAIRKDSLKPPERNLFSKEEQTYILDRSSRINGIIFPVWSDGDALSSGDLASSELPSLGTYLSSSAVWRRPSDVYEAKKLYLLEPTLSPRHIRQNVVTDCSVCSAAAICLHHHRTFDSKLGLSHFYPHNSDHLPSISTNGIYTFRFFINGSFRRISIDDRLPFSADGRPLSVSAQLENGNIDLWPALLEKTYMKLMGGYDFPGSNSSVDVHIMTGWIPEHIEINSASFVREKVFRFIKEGFNQGTCVLTLGTGSRKDETAITVSALDGAQTELLPTHSYAVLGVHEESEVRWLSILNPWSSGSSAEDNFKAADGTDRPQLLSSSSSLYLETNVQSSGRSQIDVSWEEVCIVFDGLYLNWNPSLFTRSTIFHGAWHEKTHDIAAGCAHYYLTLDISSRTDGHISTTRYEHELWILLTRHVVDKHRTGEFIAIHAVQIEQEESERDVNTLDAGLELKGSYTSSTHSLTRLAITSSSARVALIASYDGPYYNVGFSVQAFSDNADLAWLSRPRKTGYQHSIKGTFSSRNAGGNSTYPTFMNNPQYLLRLRQENTAVQERIAGKAQKFAIRLIVEGPRDVPLNVVLIWRTEEESRERVYQLRTGDAIVSSGPYSYGVAQAAASVFPGNYCIVVSTFEPRHRGTFRLRIESELRPELVDIPMEGAGMFCKTVKGAWQHGIDGGSPRFGSYHRNPMFEIDVQMATTLKMRLQLAKPSGAIALNVTLFASVSGYSSPRAASLPLDRQVITSGAYVDGARSPAGVVTPQLMVPSGKYIAVVSTFDPNVHAAFQLLVFSKSEVKVSPLLQ